MRDKASKSRNARQQGSKTESPAGNEAKPFRRKQNDRTQAVAGAEREAQKGPAEVVNRYLEIITTRFAHAKSSSPLWEQLDSAALHYVLQCIAYYTKDLPETQVFQRRKKYFTPLLTEVKRQIKILATASAKRKPFEANRPRIGRLSDMGSLSWPECCAFSLVLDKEVQRLQTLADSLKRICNKKRLGQAGNLVHLLLAQDFVDLWGQKQGKNIQLRSVEIAELIEILNERFGRAADHDRAENLRRSLDTCRSNVDNNYLLIAIRDEARSKA